MTYDVFWLAVGLTGITVNAVVLADQPRRTPEWATLLFLFISSLTVGLSLNGMIGAA